MLLQISRCDLAQFRSVQCTKMLVAQGADLPAAAEDEAARRSAAQRVRSKGQLALPRCGLGRTVCDAAGQFGGRRTNPEARLGEKKASQFLA